MNKKVFLIITIIIIIIIAIIFTVFFMNSHEKDNVLQEKVKQQLIYLEKEIINMMNELNNISFTNSSIKETTEKVTKSKDSKTEDSSSSGGSSSSTSSDSSSNSGSKDSKKSSSLSTDYSQSGSSESEISEEEIKYTTEINGILNSDLSNIDWEYLKNNIENLYSMWSTSIIDLHELNVNKQEILNFSNSLDQVALSIKNEDKVASINNLANLYAYIPKYLEEFTNESKKINIAYTKNCVLNTYVYVEQEKWINVKEQIQKAITYFTEVLNNASQDDEYSNNKLTKTYVLLNELNNTIDLNDKQLYYIKYRNVMDELVNL